MPAKRGRKRKACDACALSRVACDGDSPCESCLLKGLDCTYDCVQHPDVFLSTSRDGTTSGLHPAYRSTYKADHQETPNFQRIPVSFLLNYTDPTLQSPHDCLRLLATSGPANRTSYDLVESDQLTEAWPSIFHTFINIDALDPPSRSPDLSYGLDEPAKLTGVVDGLIRYFEAPVPSAAKERFDRVKARAFFSEANLVRFVNVFFENAYKNNPFIQRASFNINTTSTPLLLAVLLMGSTCISPEDASAAENYYDALEYSVFEDSEFRRLLFEKTPRPSAANIELIQASVLLIELQGSRRQLEAKQRIRVQRLPAIVSAVRLLNLTRVLNDTAIGDEMANLEGYVYKEVLVRLVVTCTVLATGIH